MYIMLEKENVCKLWSECEDQNGDKSESSEMINANNKITAELHTLINQLYCRSLLIQFFILPLLISHWVLTSHFAQVSFYFIPKTSTHCNAIVSIATKYWLLICGIFQWADVYLVFLKATNLYIWNLKFLHLGKICIFFIILYWIVY